MSKIVNDDGTVLNNKGAVQPEKRSDKKQDKKQDSAKKTVDASKKSAVQPKKDVPAKAAAKPPKKGLFVLILSLAAAAVCLILLFVFVFPGSKKIVSIGEVKDVNGYALNLYEWGDAISAYPSAMMEKDNPDMWLKVLSESVNKGKSLMTSNSGFVAVGKELGEEYDGWQVVLPGSTAVIYAYYPMVYVDNKQNTVPLGGLVKLTVKNNSDKEKLASLCDIIELSYK